MSIRPHHRVGPGLELRDGGLDAGGQERVEVAPDLVGVEDRVHQERLDADHLVGDRPGAVDLAHDRDVRVALPQEAHRTGDGLHRRAFAVVGGDLDLVRLADLELGGRGPVVLLRPVRLAAECVRLELGVPHRHDRVHAQDFVRGRGEARHHLGVEMGLGERRIDHVHQLDGHHRAEGAGGDLVDMAAIQRRQEATAGRHPLAGELGGDLCGHDVSSTTRVARRNCKRF